MAPEVAALWDFATRNAAAMMASKTVLMGSSADITETIPASQACAIISWVSLRVINTTRSGLVSGRASRSKARSSSTKTQFQEGSGLSTDSTCHAQLRASASRTAAEKAPSEIAS
jgi:hypothetical protein